MSLVAKVDTVMAKYRGASVSASKLHSELLDVILQWIVSEATLSCAFTGTNGTSTITRNDSLKFVSYTKSVKIPSGSTARMQWEENLTANIRTCCLTGNVSGYTVSMFKPIIGKVSLGISESDDYSSAWNKIETAIKAVVKTASGQTTQAVYGAYTGTLTITNVSI